VYCEGVNWIVAGISETRRRAVLEALVAGAPSGDRPGQHANGKITRHDEHQVPAAAGGPADEQTLADGDQTLADSEQTLADADQSSAERDQLGADSDQVASDHDQEASDRDLAHGVDPSAYAMSRDIRQRTARQRELTAAARMLSAGERDASAEARDLAGRLRDQAAAARDLAMAQRDVALDGDGERAVTGAEIVMRAAEQRRRAAQYRAQAFEHRELAAEDRRAGTHDREQAARDRVHARADREALAHALALAEVDPLTGAKTRAAGLSDLEHEVDRCRRTGSTLVVAYIDAVGLKAVNDRDGHQAGDALLKRVVAAIREHTRSYDLIVRVGGDEFVCAMSSVMLPDARDRFSAIASQLASHAHAVSIRTGFAQLTATETSVELIARADSQLIDSRRG
jgi:diguanylate cyclase (GGDEF)-like protein